MTLPEEWVSNNDWDSHRVALYLALSNTSGSVVELGCGEGSTGLLKQLCHQQSRKFTSLESNKEWASRFPFVSCVSPDYSEASLFMPCSVLFIDCAPGELRKELIRDYSHSAEVLVVHDVEPGSNYVYGMSNVISCFPYRFVYQPEGKPHTAILSHKIDVTKWNIPD